MKRILSMFLIFCMFIQLFGINGVLALDVNVDSGFVTTQPEPCGENAFWHLDKGVLTIRERQGTVLCLDRLKDLR